NPHATATGRRAGRARDSTTPRQENHRAYRRCVRAAHPAPTEAVRAARPRRRVAGAPRPLVPDRPTPQQRQPSAGRLRGPAGRRRVVRVRPRFRGADGHSVRRTPHVRPLRRPPAVTHRSTTPRQEQPRRTPRPTRPPPSSAEPPATSCRAAPTPTTPARSTRTPTATGGRPPPPWRRPPRICAPTRTQPSRCAPTPPTPPRSPSRPRATT